MKENIFLQECKYLTKEELDIIRESILFIKDKLDPEDFSHNLQIAYFLAKAKLSLETIVAGILYKTEKNKKEIEKLFGKEICNLVLSQQQLKRIKNQSKFQKTNPVRQIILTTIKDPRIIFVKLAAKLSNLKRMNGYLEEEQKKSIANEVLELYVPLANRLGLETIRKDLSDSAFEIIKPKKYNEIKKFLKESEQERQAHIKKTIKTFENLLKNKIKIIKIKGREKQIYSIYEKITKRKIPLHKQRDHFAIRIITETIEECYTALAAINNNFELVKNTTKDYIKNPKKNGYQSIHITVLQQDKKMLEVQIRTKQMDEIAEEGVAAHYLYKGMKTNKKFEKKTAWLKEILNLKEKSAINDLKLNLFEDKIYCYTPKGEAYNLPKDSSILDFAYRVHAEVGSKAVAGLVNKKFVPLKTKIKNGDIVEIITNKFQRPRRNWMKFVVTQKAKKLIARDVKRFEKIPVAKTYLKEKENKKEKENLVEIIDFPNHEPVFAQCCQPTPPEKIIGIIKSEKKILIHNENCKWIKESKKSQVPASWKEIYEKPIKLNVTAKERPGILADLLHTILRQKIKTKETNAKLIENDKAECSFILEVENVEKLEDIIERLYKIEGVNKIWLE